MTRAPDGNRTHKLGREHFDHICAIRAILTLLARRICETRIDPHDREVLRKIDLEVARRTGYSKIVYWRYKII
jgi:hypothetical protein